MGRCSSKLTTIHSIRHLPLKNKFQTSQDKPTLDQPEQDNHASNQPNRTPRNMVLPNSRRFDINYTAIPNKIHKKLTGWDNQVFGLVGLNNLGNTCFMNSALQCLLNIVPLADYFLSDLHQQEINADNFLGSKGEVVSAFASLVKQVWENNQLSEITPQQFYSAFSQFAPQFSYGTQEDSHDFLAILLDVIHEDLNRVKQRPVINESDPQGQTLQEQAANAWKNHLLRNRSIIVDLFQSQIKSSLKCHECGFVSYKFEPYMYLSLPIPEESKKQLTLYHCLDEFIKEEKLDKEERWHCPKCKAPKDSSKKIEIWNVPNILIIHLKRFKFTRHKRGKLRNVVDFPVNDLDLSSYLQCEQKDKPLYDLFAISCHEGTLGGGHYTSYVKNRDTNSWYFFNDSFVKEMDTTKAQIVDSSGYVLFYSKTSVDVFARQTISDPAAWPHFQFASRKGSENETIMQSEHSILAETPQRMRKGSVRKISKQPQKKQSVLELYEPQTHPQQVMSNRTPSSSQKKMFMQREFEHNMQINNIDLSGGHDLERSVNNLDLNVERPTLQKKRSKAKQAVLVLPKDKDTIIMDEGHFPKSSPEKKINIIGIEVKTTMQARYEIERDQDVSEGFTPPKGVYVNKTQSYYQMDFTQDINEQYQAKPIFGINPKFKLGGLRNEAKTPGFKPYEISK